MIPSLVAMELRTAIVEYLSTTFAIGDERTRDALAAFLADPTEGIFRGPYLHVRLPYRSVDSGLDNTIGLDAIRVQAVHASGSRVGSPLVPEPPAPADNRAHRDRIGKNRGVPVPDHRSLSSRSTAACTRNQALILYPMNALATDQAGRLAQLSAGDPTSPD